jgi:sarcosine oxidase subunit beta
MVGIGFELIPTAIQMCATVRTAAKLDILVQHIGQGLSVKQSGAGNILVGGGWPAASNELGGRPEVSVGNLIANMRLAVRILPFLSELRILRAWAGPYSVTRDELPVIGEMPQRPGFFVAGGPHAFTLGPLWGKVVRDLILGRTPMVELGGLGPERLVKADQLWSSQVDLGSPNLSLGARSRSHG